MLSLEALSLDRLIVPKWEVLCAVRLNPYTSESPKFCVWACAHVRERHSTRVHAT